MSTKRIVLGHDDTLDIHIKGLGVIYTVQTAPEEVFDNPLDDNDPAIASVSVTVTSAPNGTYVDQDTFPLEDLEGDPEAQRRYWQRLKHTEVPSREEDR